MIEVLITTLRNGSPLVYVALAGMIAQRCGVWHLGLEGLMIMGACASVIGATLWGSWWAGMALAIPVCMLGGALLWFAIERLKAAPIIAGLGLTGLGLGGTDLCIQAVFGSQGALFSPVGLPRLGEHFGSFGVLSVLTVAMPIVVALSWLVIKRTRFGLKLTACGDHPFAARAVGVSPSRMRLYALATGGVLCALGGTDLALGTLQTFSINMTAGRGFMGFAAVIFGGGDPIGSTLAALFFSAVESIGVAVQISLGSQVSQILLLALPYIATVLGLWISAAIRKQDPASSQASELRDY